MHQRLSDLMQSNTPDEIFFDPDIYDSQFAYQQQFTDIPFWIDLAKSFGPKVLELACGMGRVTIPTYESGIDVDGMDFSESMLRVARERAKAKGLPIKFFLGDLRTMTIHDKYDFMFLPTGTISHLTTRGELESFLSGARKALHVNGVLALDAHNPTKTFLRSLPLSTEPVRSSFQHHETKEVIQLETTQTYHADTQIHLVKFHYTFSNGSTKDAAIVIKLYFPAELQSLLHYNGFDVEKIYGDYTRDNFNSESAKYVILAKKRA